MRPVASYSSRFSPDDRAQLAPEVPGLPTRLTTSRSEIWSETRTSAAVVAATCFVLSALTWGLPGAWSTIPPRKGDHRPYEERKLTRAPLPRSPNGPDDCLEPQRPPSRSLTKVSQAGSALRPPFWPRCRGVVSPSLALLLGHALGLEDGALLAVFAMAALPTARNVWCTRPRTGAIRHWRGMPEC
jgi:hypothetical protein